MNYFSCTNNNEYFTSINQQKCKEILKEIEILREKIESEYKSYRDKFNRKIYLINTKNVKRKIITPFGEIIFYRTLFQYRSKRKWKYIFPLDKALNLKPYRQYDERYLNNIKEKLLNGTFNLKHLAEINFFKTYKSTVHYFIKRNELIANKPIFKNKLKENLPLYINVDDTFLNLKENNRAKKFRIRLIVIHQGKNIKNNKLINPSYNAFIFEKNFRNYTKKDKDLIVIKSIKLNYYGNCKNKILCSDGSSEFRIQSQRMDLKHCQDKYHVFRSNVALMGLNKQIYYGFKREYLNNVREILKNYLESGNIKTSILLLKTIAKKTKYDQFKTKLFKFIKWLNLNEKSIRFWNSKDYYPVTTEGFVFHKIKSILGNKDKCYSIQIFKKLLSTKLNLINF